MSIVGKNKAYYNSQQILAIEFIVVMQHLVQFNCQVVGFMQISFVPTATTIAMVNKTMSQPIDSMYVYHHSGAKSTKNFHSGKRPNINYLLN